MDLNERFNVLVQGVELAQKKGILSLENAVEAKVAIDTIQKGEKLKESLGSLAAMCEFAQKSGTYNLHDAAFLYNAIDGLDEEIEKFITENSFKESVVNGDEVNEDKNNIEITTVDTETENEPTKKASKKKK